MTFWEPYFKEKLLKSQIFQRTLKGPLWNSLRKLRTISPSKEPLRNVFSSSIIREYLKFYLESRPQCSSFTKVSTSSEHLDPFNHIRNHFCKTIFRKHNYSRSKWFLDQSLCRKTLMFYIQFKPVNFLITNGFNRTFRNLEPLNHTKSHRGTIFQRAPY